VAEVSNVNAHHHGRAVQALPTVRRDGIWAGAQGRIVHVESHGSNPWTRYTVEFHGSRYAGLVLGTDIEFAQPETPVAKRARRNLEAQGLLPHA
jgi:hypothetical protein